ASLAGDRAVTSLELWPVGNCQVSALIDPLGSLVWGCVPRVDGDPAFCALLKNGNPDGAGAWRIELENQVSVKQHYLRNTPILVSRLTDASGGEVDVFSFCPRLEREGRMYRPVAFARIVRPVSGSPRLKVCLRPMTG